MKELYLEEMSDEWNKISEIFPQILRTSTFNRCVEDFEHMLLSLAKVHQHQTETSIGLGDLRGDGLRKASLYFSKVAGIPLPTETAEWNLVMDAATIRNILVHNGGRVNPTSPTGGDNRIFWWVERMQVIAVVRLIFEKGV